MSDVVCKVYSFRVSGPLGHIENLNPNSGTSSGTYCMDIYRTGLAEAFPTSNPTAPKKPQLRPRGPSQLLSAALAAHNWGTTPSKSPPPTRQPPQNQSATASRRSSTLASTAIGCDAPVGCFFFSASRIREIVP